jgi:flagellar basal body-associated protein FliL
MIPLIILIVIIIVAVCIAAAVMSGKCSREEDAQEWVQRNCVDDRREE